jgi:NAD(P)H-hydrate repair Nnr-like enzyme with NAD(P)H-hydrate dehydratase domain
VDGAVKREPFEVPPELRVLPRRSPSAHKGDFGRVLIVGGSYGMHGAPVLSASAAFRSGAGLVTVALPRSIYPIAGPAERRALRRVQANETRTRKELTRALLPRLDE